MTTPKIEYMYWILLNTYPVLIISNYLNTCIGDAAYLHLKHLMQFGYEASVPVQDGQPRFVNPSPVSLLEPGIDWHMCSAMAL